MKVLHILNELNPSGAEVMIEVASETFRLNNVEAYILGTGKIIGPYKDNLERVGFRIFHIPLKPLSSFYGSFRKLMRQHQFDIVHIHSEGATLFVTTILKFIGHKKIIRTVHHIWPYQKILPFIKRYIFRFIVNRIYKVKSVSNSITGQKNERKCYHIKNELIPNWYDNTKFIPISYEEKQAKRKEYGLQNDVMVFVSLGKNWPYKNFDLILEAFAGLSSYKIKYLQIGPEFKEKQLSNLSKRLGLSSDKVELLGKVEEPLDFMYLADVFIMPSSNEGFGNAVLEAVGCGLPAILSDVPALFDYKNYFKGIYWINPTKSDLIEAVLHFIKLDRKAVFNIGQLNTELVRDYFGIQVGVKSYIDLYNRL